MRANITVALFALLIGSTVDARPRPRIAQEQNDPDQKDPDKDDGDGPEAQAVLPLKLDDLIEVAIRLAPDATRAKVDRVAAKNLAEGERRQQAWIVSSNGQYQRNALAEDVEAPPFSIVSQEKISASLGLGRNLPTGGNVSVEAGVARESDEYLIVTRLRDTANAQAPAGTDPNGNPYDYLFRNTASLRATLRQPIARGFGPKVALAPITKADLNASAETVKAQLATEELVRDLVVGYWDLALKSFEVDVRAQALDFAQKQEQLTHEQIRAGSAPSNAANAVTYEIAMRQDALLRAQLELENMSLTLRQKSGLELGRRDVALRPAERFEIGEDEFDVDEILERSHAANRKLATIQLQKKAADLDVTVARDQMKPQVDFTFSGAIMGNGDDAASAVSGVGGADSYEVMVGLQVQFELSGAAGKARDAAIAKRKRLDIDREDAVRQIDVAVVNSVHMVTSARTRVALADKAIIVAEENVRAERASFMVGRTTNFNVMQRQTELIDARLRRGQAVADYHKAVAQLQFLSGILLDQYRVNVKPRGERR
ncbi:MAG TPA: TolC family protein [Kofleriaceae bacterium]|nr:TolC family protein [Kofleriaceae bacterium]